MDLQSLQRELVRSLFEDGGCLPGLIRGANPIDRLRVYRNNAFNNYRDALTDVYPAITIERLAPGEYAFLAGRIRVSRRLRKRCDGCGRAHRGDRSRYAVRSDAVAPDTDRARKDRGFHFSVRPVSLGLTLPCARFKCMRAPV